MPPPRKEERATGWGDWFRTILTAMFSVVVHLYRWVASKFVAFWKYLRGLFKSPSIAQSVLILVVIFVLLVLWALYGLYGYIRSLWSLVEIAGLTAGIGVPGPAYVWTILMPLVAFVVLIYAYNRRYPGSPDLTTTTGNWLARSWREHDMFRSLLGFATIWVEIYLLLPEWWAKRWLENMPYLLVTILMLMFARLISAKPTKRTSERIGKIAMILGAVVLANYIFLKSDYSLVKWEEARQKVKSWWYGGNPVSLPTFGKKTVVIPQRDGVLGLNIEGEKYVRKFWTDRLPLVEAEKMIEHARRESNFNQLRPDGRPYKVVPNDPRDDTTAVGVMQIKESLWGNKAYEKGYDIFTLDGNLEFALWLYNLRVSEGRRGDIDWDATSPGRRLTVIAPAPDKEPSQWIKVCKQTTVRAAGRIWIYTDLGGRYPSDNDGLTDPEFEGNSIRFQSRIPGEDVEVTVILDQCE